MNRRHFIATATPAALVAACTTATTTGTVATPPGTPPVGSTPPGGMKLTPVPVPSSGAYLGARLDSGLVQGVGKSPGAAQFAQQEAFEASVGRHMDFVPIYLGFGTVLPMASLTATGQAIPLVDLSEPVISTINSGASDAYLAQLGATLKAYGKPVFTRPFWEMNLAAKALAAGGTPADFIAAWIRVRNALPSNVSLIWCPSGGGVGANPFFPGVAYVDWVGLDGFDRQTTAIPGGFAKVVAVGYANLTTLAPGIPVMIGATGAIAVNQVSYLSEIQTDLPAKYPQIKALNYFDAKGDNGDFTLSTDGLAAFKAMAGSAAFTVALPH